MKDSDAIQGDEFLSLFLGMTKLHYIEVIRTHDLARKCSAKMGNMTNIEMAKAGRDWLLSKGMGMELLKDIPENHRRAAINLFGDTLLEELNRLAIANN